MNLNADKMLEDAMLTMHEQVARLKKKSKAEDDGLSLNEVAVLERCAMVAMRYMDHEEDEGRIVRKHLASLSEEEWQLLVNGGKGQ